MITPSPAVGIARESCFRVRRYILAKAPVEICDGQVVLDVEREGIQMWAEEERSYELRYGPSMSTLTDRNPTAPSSEHEVMQ
jgi:hypothetical protein